MSRRKERDARYNALVSDYRKIAKRADQRLLELERLSTQKGFENVKEWAYRVAMRNIKYWNGEGSKRFNTKPPNDIGLLKAKMRDIEEFLQSVTSTKSGIKKVYQKRVNEINKKYGTKFTWEDIGKYFERKGNEKLDKQYGSKTMLMAIGIFQKNENIINDLEEGQQVDLKISKKDKSNEKLMNTIKKLLEDYGKDVVNLY